MKKNFIFLFILALFPLFMLPQNSAEKEDLMNSFFDKGYEQIYIQKDSAFSNFEKALLWAIEIENLDVSLDILDEIVITADYYSDFPRFYTALQRMDSIFKIEGIDQKLTDVEARQINTVFSSADYHFEIQEYVKAKELYLQVLNYYDSILPEERSEDQIITLYSLYSSLGTTYMYLDKFELSELYYQRGIKLIRSSSAFEQYKEAYLNSAKQSMAQLYTRMGKHKEATEFNQENLKLTKIYYQKDKRYRNNLVNSFQKFTVSYIAQDSLQRALETLDESIPYLPENDPFHKEALLLYGDIYLGLGLNSMALTSYEKALVVFQSYSQNKTHRDLAKIYSKIAKYHLKQGEYEEGLHTVIAAFNVSGTNVNVTDNEKNPSPKDVFSRTQLLQLLTVKLQLLQLAFEETNQKNYQDDALNTCNAILETFDILKGEFDSKLDKTFLADKVYPAFQLMLDVAFSTYESHPSNETLQLAFTISEKNKDFLLLEALRNANAKAFTNVPTNLMDKEAQLRAEISYLEKEIFETEGFDGKFSNKLFSLKKEYYTFLDTLKLNYPEYHNLKYGSGVLKLSTLREETSKDNSTLVTYTMGEDFLYVIVINESKEAFLKMPFTEKDKADVRNFYKLLSSPSIVAKNEDISAIGQSLFEKVLAKPLANFEGKNLTIIPDGVLHYLPFEMLVQKGSYLLEENTISYGNSLASLIALKNKEHASVNRMLAFAPEFDIGTVQEAPEEQTRQLGKLTYNDDEVNGIKSYFNASIFANERATLASFMSEVGDANIIHLATHASANDEYPDYSYLAFSETTPVEDDQILYIKDLYNMKINADMVTLSACQTGIGKLQSGQGMLSLSKGFYYAGAKSLVNTLWKINDKSTVKLMEYFYEGLSEGKSKKAALREAKLKYLETTDDDLLKHPYYWAAFVVSGDTTPITPKKNYWWIVVVGASLLTFVFLYSRRRNRFKKVSLAS